MGLRVEFFRADDPGTRVGAAEWTEPGVPVEAPDDRRRAVLGRVCRRVPVTVEDAAFRQAGTSGPTVFHPGTIVWFNAAARTRAEEEGLKVRFVPRVEHGIGWDPAGAYRPFAQAVERMAAAGNG